MLTSASYSNYNNVKDHYGSDTLSQSSFSAPPLCLPFEKCSSESILWSPENFEILEVRTSPLHGDNSDYVQYLNRDLSRGTNESNEGIVTENVAGELGGSCETDGKNEESFRAPTNAESKVVSPKPSQFHPKMQSSPTSAAPPVRACLICADVASGQHYGAASCEACKAFFKRTVQGKIMYSCLANGRCVMTKRGRKACQACRYDKCVQVGMLREGIRSDGHRGGQKIRPFTLKLNQPDSSISSRSPSCESTPTGEGASSTVNQLLRTLLNIEPQKVYAMPPNTSSFGDNFKLASTLSDLTDRELVATISWAKQLPGFSELTVSDQMCLLRSGWHDVICLNVAYRSAPFNGVLYFADDLRLSADEAAMLNIPADLDASMRRLAGKLTSMAVTREEYVLLKALVLAHTDADVEQVTPVEQLRNALYDALLQYERARGDVYLRRVGNLLLVLPLVVCTKLRLRDYWTAVKQSGQTITQRLLREMVDYSCRR